MSTTEEKPNQSQIAVARSDSIGSLGDVIPKWLLKLVLIVVAGYCLYQLWLNYGGSMGSADKTVSLNVPDATSVSSLDSSDVEKLIKG